LAYSERLKRANLLILELRRLHVDHIWCYKILFGHVDMQSENFFEWAPHLRLEVISINYTRLEIWANA